MKDEKAEMRRTLRIRLKTGSTDENPQLTQMKVGVFGATPQKACSGALPATKVSILGQAPPIIWDQFFAIPNALVVISTGFHPAWASSMLQDGTSWAS